MGERPHRFTLRVEGERRALLYDRARQQYASLTAGQTFLLLASLEVGRASAIRLLAESLGADAAALALASVDELGALPDDGAFAGRVVELPAVAGGFAAPLVTHLGVTLACNFSCAHCYSSSGTRLPDELSFEEISRLVEELAALGCCKLVLGGGEPFLRRELPEVVAAADALGVDTWVHTNASLLKASVLERLARCPPAGLAVSLDGATTATNDAIRGPGTFDAALAGCALLRAHYPPGFNVSVTVSPANAHEMVAVVDQVAQLGARTLLLRPQYPAGQARQGAAQACDRDTFTRAVEAARARAREVGLSLDAPHPLEGAVPSFEGFGCVAARVVAGVTPNGRVTPCLNLDPSFESGSLREQPLQALWAKGRAFVAVRAQEPNAQCASCRHYDTCRGGCRVRALFSGNGLNGPDSWCHWEPKVTAGAGDEAPRAEGATSPS